MLTADAGEVLNMDRLDLIKSSFEKIKKEREERIKREVAELEEEETSYDRCQELHISNLVYGIYEDADERPFEVEPQEGFLDDPEKL
jgi:hypothetical protein